MNFLQAPKCPLLFPENYLRSPCFINAGSLPISSDYFLTFLGYFFIFPPTHPQRDCKDNSTSTTGKILGQLSHLSFPPREHPVLPLTIPSILPPLFAFFLSGCKCKETFNTLQLFWNNFFFRTFSERFYFQSGCKCKGANITVQPFY